MADLPSVAIIGSGNWGTVIAKIIASNLQNSTRYNKTVRMWVFEEMIEGKKLSEIINTKHENVKYFPGLELPKNVVAEPDVAKCAEGAKILVFVIPHQFLEKTCQQMKSSVRSDAVGISLIKGLGFNDAGKIALISDLIRQSLKIPCAVLMGANLAVEVGQENFCEATIASKNVELGKELKDIFQTKYFRISCIKDEAGTELCGALKNIVAVGAGVAQGLGYGNNTVAAIIRLGFMEMKSFIFEFFGDREPCTSTFMQSCGMADLITTCYGGRNKKIGTALTQSKKSVQELEKELLQGQSAQGPLTADEVHVMLKKLKKENDYPLFTAVHKICKREIAPEHLIDSLDNHPEHL